MSEFDSTRFRPPRDEQEREAFRRSTRIAFSAGEPDRLDPYLALHDPSDLRVLVDEDGGVGAALVRLPMGHFFAGVRVPTLGVAAVSVPPELRGSGSATAMMRAFVGEASAEGIPLASLFASTQALYRRAGFEQAGHFCRYAIPLATIGVHDREPAVRAGTEADRDAVRACYTAMARCVHGALDRCEAIWTRVFTHEQKVCEIALVSERIDGREDVTGSLVYRIDQSATDGRAQSLWVQDLSFTTPAAGRRLLAYLARCGPIATEAIVHCGPASALLHMLADNTYRVRATEHWMLRVVDVRGAIEARPYAAGLSTRFVLDVHDDLIPANNGRLEVSIADGRARVAPGGRSDAPVLGLDVRALAPLYTGFLSPESLRRAGAIEASDEAVAAVAPVFAAPAPSMMDMF